MQDLQDKRIDRSFLWIIFSMIFFLGLLPPVLSLCRELPLSWRLFAGAYPLQITYVLTAFYFAKRFHSGKNMMQTLDLTGVPPRITGRTLLETAGMFFLLSLITGAYIWILQKLRISLEPQTVIQLLRSGPEEALLILLPAAVIAAPLGEELAFRHILYRKFCSLLPPAHAAVFCSLIFAAVHLNIRSFPALFLLGLYLCRSYQKHGSLLPCILAHAFFNAITAGLVLLMRFQILPGS